MSVDPLKLNLFGSASGLQGVSPTKAVAGQSSEGSGGTSSTSSNMFSDSTAGVNTNIGVGDTMNIPAQAGKKAGLGRTLGFA